MTKEEFELHLEVFQNAADPRFKIQVEPYLNDDREDEHVEWPYVLHLAWAARAVAAIGPARHVDISSYIYFPALLSAFIPVDYYEHRRFRPRLPDLRAAQADLLSLPFPDGSVPSLSCLHTIEHVGLGRYGDTLDPQGDRRAAGELTRVLAPGGHLLICCPVGPPVLRFNSCRVYSYQQVLDLFPSLTLRNFALVPWNSSGEMIDPADPADVADQVGDGAGCFWFVKEEA